MYAPLLISLASFVGGEPIPPPPPPPAVVVLAPAAVAERVEIQATPEIPIHDGQPQAPEGQTALDATIIPDDGYGFPVETGPAEIRRLTRPSRPLSAGDLELCGVKPWLCDDNYAG